MIKRLFSFIMNPDKVEIRIKYDGQLTQIDANTLVSSLFHFLAIVDEVSTTLNQRINIQVEAVEKGSFDVILVAKGILNHLRGIFKNISLTDVYQVVQIILSLFLIKAHLKDKKATKEKQNGDIVILINDENKELKVPRKAFQLYRENETVNEALTKLFERLKEDPSIEGYAVVTKDTRNVFYAKRTLFPALTTPNPYLEEDKKIDLIENVPLSILKLVFVPDRKWEFIYEGNKISAYILDKSFFKRIEEGEAFAKGDVIIADMEIVKVFDKSVKTYLNKEYRIIKVKKHHKANTVQQKLF